MININLTLMEQFVRNLQVRILCLLTILTIFQFFNVVGQSPTPPQFSSGKGGGEAQDYMELGKTMSNIEKDSIYRLPKCYAGMGTFSFYITSTGVVDIVNFSGNLPSGIIAKIKQNILTTSGKWTPELENGKPIDSKPFIFIYYLNILSCEAMPSYQRNEQEMSFLLEKAINSLDNKKFTILKNAYLLPVGGIDVMR